MAVLATAPSLCVLALLSYAVGVEAQQLAEVHCAFSLLNGRLDRPQDVECCGA